MNPQHPYPSPAHPQRSESSQPDESSLSSDPASPTTGGSESALPRVRYRIRFAKTGLLRWISHRDLARLWERLLRRAALKLSMTEGFHPKPRVAFPSALALGIESWDEVVEIELAEELAADELLDRLCSDQQPGLHIRQVQQMPPGCAKAQLQSSDYVVTIPDKVDLAEVSLAIERLLQSATTSFQRQKKKITVDVAEQIRCLEVFGQRKLFMTLSANATASLRPGDVLEIIGAADWTECGAVITRTSVVLQAEISAHDRAKLAHVTDFSLAEGADE